MRLIPVTLIRFAYLGLLLLGGATSAWAESPKALAQDYWLALKEEGFGAATRFIHPDASAEFKDMMLPVS